VVIKFNNNVGLGVTGILNALGTTEEPIYFTSYRDDFTSGDTNPAQAGDWNKIGVYGTATLENCLIRYGGSDDYRDGMVWTDGNGNLNLTKCTISESKHNGLKISDSSGAHSIAGCTIKDNNNGAGIDLIRSTANIYQSRIHNNKVGISCDDANPIIGGSASNGNCIYDNTDYGVQNITAETINAQYNFWGKQSGPTHSTNAQGTGDKVSNNVNFSHFLATCGNGPVVVDPDKMWTIRFSKAVDYNNSNNIFVNLNDDGFWRKVTGTTIEVDQENPQLVYVYAPAANYEHGKTYKLVVTTSVKSADGQYLSTQATKDFTIN